jgi:plastocyanin
MSRGRKWITSACLATGCVMGSLAIGMGIAAAASVTPAPVVTTPGRQSATTTAPATATTTPATTAPATAAPTTPPTTAPAITDPFQPRPRSAATAHVSIVDFGYSPATITVTVGTTVTWSNTGSVIHSVTSDTGAFDSSPSCPTGACIDPGGSFSHVFSTAGTFTYHCRVHSNMHGTVIVKAAAPVTTPTTAPGSPASVGGAGSTTVAAQASGPQLAFTGASSNEAWIALGALFTITLGLALRPRRRPFPVPVSIRATDSNRVR